MDGGSSNYASSDRKSTFRRSNKVSALGCISAPRSYPEEPLELPCRRLCGSILGLGRGKHQKRAFDQIPIGVGHIRQHYHRHRPSRGLIWCGIGRREVSQEAKTLRAFWARLRDLCRLTLSLWAQ